MEKKTEKITVSLSPEVIRLADQNWEKFGFKNRSELIDASIRECSIGDRAWSAHITVGGDAATGESTLIAVTGVGTWRARYRGTELPLRPRVPGTFELSLPRGTEGVLELERV